MCIIKIIAKLLADLMLPSLVLLSWSISNHLRKIHIAIADQLSHIVHCSLKFRVLNILIFRWVSYTSAKSVGGSLLHML